MLFLRPFKTLNNYVNSGATFAHFYMVAIAHILALPVLVLPLENKESVMKDISKKISNEVTSFYYALIVGVLFSLCVESLIDYSGLLSTGFMFVCLFMAVTAVVSFFAHLVYNKVEHKHQFLGYGCVLWLIQSLLMIPSELVTLYLGDYQQLLRFICVLILLPITMKVLKQHFKSKQMD